jgi:hypothetical protein
VVRGLKCFFFMTAISTGSQSVYKHQTVYGHTQPHRGVHACLGRVRCVRERRCCPFGCRRLHVRALKERGGRDLCHSTTRTTVRIGSCSQESLLPHSLSSRVLLCSCLIPLNPTPDPTQGKTGQGLLTPKSRLPPTET